MLMRIKISGMGAALKGVSIGANIYTGAYLQFKLHTSSAVFYNMAIHSYLDVGGSKGTLLMGHIETEFFSLDANRHPWIKDLDSLIGEKLALVVSGPLLIDGNVSIKLTHINPDGDVDILLSKEDIPAVGGQISDTMVKGEALKISSKESLSIS